MSYRQGKSITPTQHTRRLSTGQRQLLGEMHARPSTADPLRARSSSCGCGGPARSTALRSAASALASGEAFGGGGAAAAAAASAAAASASAALALAPNGGGGGARRDDGVVFADSQHAPGVPVVYRTATEKLSNPERLNLDRRGLKACPVLEGEERLRLLNYQNNAISFVANLHNLPNLIFLDLYSNQIRQISGLEAVPTLRVLMLGKNLIAKIERLDALSKLDVLDLHCNHVKRIEGLSRLYELRVLNLAGNQIEVVDGAVSRATALPPAAALRGTASECMPLARRRRRSTASPR